VLETTFVGCLTFTLRQRFEKSLIKTGVLLAAVDWALFGRGWQAQCHKTNISWLADGRVSYQCYSLISISGGTWFNRFARTVRSGMRYMLTYLGYGESFAARVRLFSSRFASRLKILWNYMAQHSDVTPVLSVDRLFDQVCVQFSEPGVQDEHAVCLRSMALTDCKSGLSGSGWSTFWGWGAWVSGVSGFRAQSLMSISP
jgi:hypothetical protein